MVGQIAVLLAAAAVAASGAPCGPMALLPPTEWLPEFWTTADRPDYLPALVNFMNWQPWTVLDIKWFARRNGYGAADASDMVFWAAAYEWVLRGDDLFAEDNMSWVFDSPASAVEAFLADKVRQSGVDPYGTRCRRRRPRASV